ncbi:MAG: carbon-nitrogen hydrolase [Spirochaetes bacterium]|nr:carbon-nitrogen hydrolase [Spirochaetota bacterium]
MKKTARKKDERTVLGVIQMGMTKNADYNVKKAVAMVTKARREGANVICLPELYRSQYFCQTENAMNFDLAEPAEGPSFATFAPLAKKIDAVIIVPFFERRAAGIYHNSALIIDTDGKAAGMYRKMHIPDDPNYYEKFYFTPGDLGFNSFITAHGAVGTLICWDQWYPEAARLTALDGAMMLCYPTAIGWHPREKREKGAAQLDAWMTVQRGHAIANGIYVAAANRIGLEKPADRSDGIEFWGSSFIADPQGVIIAQASVDKEEILIADIDTTHMENIRRNWPFFRDRRIDAFKDITKRYRDDGNDNNCGCGDDCDCHH